MGKSKSRFHPNRLGEAIELIGISESRLSREIGWVQSRASLCVNNKAQLPVWVAVEMQSKYGIDAAFVLGISDEPHPECRECSIVMSTDGEWECSKCGQGIYWDSMDPKDPPNCRYCPNCGRVNVAHR